MSLVSTFMLIAGGIGLVCWLLQREEKTVAKSAAERPDPYDEGESAAKDGEPFWAKPYCVPSGSARAHDRWFAGWSFGKQQSKEAP